jgi:hypothetical protein
MDYDLTLKHGNTTLHFVGPKEVTEEEKERILAQFHAAGWAIALKNKDEEADP